MGRGKHSKIEKHRSGCLTGCLVRILVLLGIAALVFVFACMTGIITNDPDTGEPKISFEQVHAPELGDFHLDFSQLGKTAGDLLGKLPAFSWKFGVNAKGLTVKVLHAGDGECIMICSDGYVMVADAGSGSGNWISGQMLIGGVRHINVLAALSSDDTNISGMKTLLTRYKPGYLVFQNSQTKGNAYNQMIAAAEGISGLERVHATKGMSFQMGNAQVTVVGPTNTYHRNSLDDGLSLRIDYGQKRILILGTLTGAGGQDMASLGRDGMADVLVVGNGGAALSAQLLDTVRPRYVFVAGIPDEGALSRARTWGANVFTVHDNGLLSVHTDGTSLELNK